MNAIILFAPLLGAVIAGFGWRIIGDRGAQIVTTALLFLSAVLSWWVFLAFDGTTQHIALFRWIDSGTLVADWGMRIDRLTVIMLIVVTTVSAFVHLYSMGYMADDDNFREGESYRPRFFALLSFFTFAMLALVSADNILQLFFGWEGVGVSSYFLIGFYWRKQSAGAAAIKAFVVNRVGDFGFLLGIFALYWVTDSLKFDDIFAEAPRMGQETLGFLWGSFPTADLIGMLLFVGAMGKSAQFLLHTWLPDAMEGPTPVSALIHAATMVTAGVFLVCRMSPVYEFAPYAKMVVVYIGAATAFFAATVALVQNDIKRVIAYSTCSQLGYMFVAAGVGVYSAAMFHLLTHAFFKALLFLCSGSVIVAMHHEQDMRNYGGLRTRLPVTYWTMMIGTLAITGVGIPLTSIGFAGYLSKDAIIESAWGSGIGVAFWSLVISALFTSFYSWRLMFLTFHGTARGDMHAHEHAKESPKVMLVPLAALAVGAVLAGMVWNGPFFADHAKVTSYFGIAQHEVADGGVDEGVDEGATDESAGADVAGTEVAGVPPVTGALYVAPDNTVLEEAHAAPVWVKVSPFVAMLLGLIVAWYFYLVRPDVPERLARSQRPLHRFLMQKWYFDVIYDFVFVAGANALGRFLWKRGDGTVIDGTINGVAMGAVPLATRINARWQSGYLFTYAFAMVIGIAVLVTWMVLAGGVR